jgi:uncharacterized protein (DUF924 family)
MRVMNDHPLQQVLDFWFPTPAPRDHAEMVARQEWWFRGGADAQILERFVPLFERIARGELDRWAKYPAMRLAMIVVLDQFSRTIHRGTALVYAQDPKARALARDGIAAGHYAALSDPWEKTFFLLPLGHSEDVSDLDYAVQLAEELAAQATDTQARMLEFSANQARSHREVLRRFGRQPHRNEILGRRSTPEELTYLAKGELVHQRAVPR